MKLLVLVCLASAVYSTKNEPNNIQNGALPLPRADLEDVFLQFVDFINKYGYPVEEHQVTTPDGYILTIHRIPHGKNSSTEQRGVVFLQHGILCSSIDWAITGPEKGLAYLLADRGYDVWLGNARGNTYSKQHIDLSNKEKKYWSFSWHEIGAIDLPTMIDYVLEKTGEAKLHYIGHGQGTTVFYVMASVRPEYNDKIRGHYSLAPTAYMNHMTSPLLRLLAVTEGGLRFIFDLIEMYEFLPSKGLLTMVAKKSCGHAIFQPLCTNALFALCGFNNKQFNATLLPIVMGHTPAGSSLRQVLHYAQLVNSGKFRQYDFGLFGNHKKYGRLTPSNYNLKKITAAVYLFYSHNDWLASETDVRKLKQQLINAQINKLVLNTNNQFNHLDYLYGIDAKTLVYDKVFEVMLLH